MTPEQIQHYQQQIMKQMPASLLAKFTKTTAIHHITNPKAQGKHQPAKQVSSMDTPV